MRWGVVWCGWGWGSGGWRSYELTVLGKLRTILGYGCMDVAGTHSKYSRNECLTVDNESLHLPRHYRVGTALIEEDNGQVVLNLEPQRSLDRLCL